MSPLVVQMEQSYLLTRASMLPFSFITTMTYFASPSGCSSLRKTSCSSATTITITSSSLIILIIISSSSIIVIIAIIVIRVAERVLVSAKDELLLGDYY